MGGEQGGLTPGSVEAAAPTPGEAERAFERGDWREARRLARAQLEAGGEHARTSARATLGRFRTDPVVLALYAAALALLAAVAWATFPR